MSNANYNNSNIHNMIINDLINHACFFTLFNYHLTVVERREGMGKDRRPNVINDHH